ncbi:MAG: hypothetical protein Q8O38_10895 [Sulfurimicrobium sp.]|nr:hypothetical protein [Sulfurimicrobium sp.]
MPNSRRRAASSENGRRVRIQVLESLLADDEAALDKLKTAAAAAGVEVGQ